jgi:hypothetical protein
MINEQEGQLLKQSGLTHVAQIFQEDDLSGQLTHGDADLAQRLGQGEGQLIFKCKKLREALSSKRWPLGASPAGNFAHCLKTKKWSTIFRRLRRENADSKMEGPPAFFTRRRDGIPVPTLAKFMQGYTNILKMKLSSKTLENSFLIMNRQVWTNQKQFLSNRQGEEGGEEGTDKCNLCNSTENSLHLLFECEVYAEPLWNLLQQAINGLLQQRLGGHPGVTLHAYNIMYNNNIQGLPKDCGDQFYTLVQEIKRNIVFRRVKRITTNAGLRIDHHRIKCHMTLNIQRLISLREFQGKGSELLGDLLTQIQNM